MDPGIAILIIVIFVFIGMNIGLVYVSLKNEKMAVKPTIMVVKDERFGIAGTKIDTETKSALYKAVKYAEIKPDLNAFPRNEFEMAEII